MIQSTKMMMTGVTAPAIAPGAMGLGPGVSMAAVEEREDAGKKRERKRVTKGGKREGREGRDEKGQRGREGRGKWRREKGRGERKKIIWDGREEESSR